MEASNATNATSATNTTKDRGSFDKVMSVMFVNGKYREYLFYAHMISQCQVVIDRNMKAPAGVSFNSTHYNLYINPNMFDAYTIEERLFILQHEMHHILENHVSRKGDRKHEVWNYATDCAINQLGNYRHIPKDGIVPKLLEEALGIKLPERESSETYYDLLANIMPPEQSEQGNQSEQGDQNSTPKPTDMHEKWEESTGNDEFKNARTKEMIEKSAENTLKKTGNLPANYSKWLEIHTVKSQISWQKVLKNIMGNKKMFSRPTFMKRDRRQPGRVEIRGRTKKRVFNVLAITDVSGSMSSEVLSETMTELKTLCKLTGSELDLIQVDAVAKEPEKFKTTTKFFERKGSGGTYLTPALEMAKKHKITFDAVVVITDGFLFDNDIDAFLEINKRVIWIVEANGHVMNEMNQGKMSAYKLKSE